MPINDWSDSIAIAELSDEPNFSEDMDSLMRRIQDKGDESPDVILNMVGVTHLNSSNLASILKLRKMLMAANRRLRICSINDHVWSIMLITGLDQLFEFTEDISTSLASLQLDL
ncbi:MAG: STAS domain-containing protein [Phycisphaerales bacterium]|jgi:anti-anti-sigma factor|nr:STAS domain-containing protein [Phycisphaerales bacterium]